MIEARRKFREQTPKPKGRRPNAGIDDFWIEAAGLVHEGKQGRPNQTQKEFIAVMVKWCSTKMGTPYSEDTVTEKIEKLWRRWKLRGVEIQFLPILPLYSLTPLLRPA
jgi:hypothetical protein